MGSDKKYEALVVIPCLNEELYIKGLLENLVQQSRSINMLIVVADGNSVDRTPAIVQSMSEKHSNVVLLPNPKRIQSAGVNLAVSTYGHEATYLIRIDAHAEYPLDFCQKLIEDAKAMGADSVVVAMNTIGNGFFQSAVADTQNSKLGNGGSSHRLVGREGKWVDHGHHALMATKAYSSVNGYDENFPQNQDAELDIRLHKAGYKVWLTGNTSMDYYPRSTIRTLFIQYYKFGQGRLKTLVKHRVRPHLRQALPVLIAPIMVALLLLPVHAIFALPALSYLTVCIAYGLIQAIKCKSLHKCLIGPLAVTMHFAWSLGFWKGMFKALIENCGSK